MRILIAGGGIGGLTLALMLHQRGIEALVFEAAPAVRPLGVGINVLPHSIRELAALGLLPALDAVAIRTRTLSYLNHLGQVIWSEPRGLHAGLDAPQFSIHRGNLQMLLWDAARQRLCPETIRSGARVTALHQDGSGVTAEVRTATGGIETVAGDGIVGADGIHSALRAMLLQEDAGICWNGIMMWRGAVDWPAFDGGEAMIIAGDAVAKLVLYPIGPGTSPDRRLTNWVVYARVAAADAPPPARESWSEPGSFDEVEPLIARFRLPFVSTEALVRATPQIFKYPMADREPLPVWTRGRVTLLGDAAHSMYPVGSNGASQAILDARCLSDLLVDRPLGDAFALYEAERRPATSAVVRSNRNGGPERVIDLVASRAPEGFARLSDVATAPELEEIVRGYARLAGFAASNEKRASP